TSGLGSRRWPARSAARPHPPTNTPRPARRTRSGRAGALARRPVAERRRVRPPWAESGSHGRAYRPSTERAAAERRRRATIRADAPTAIANAAATTPGQSPFASDGRSTTADVFSSARSDASTFVTGPSAVELSIAPPTPLPTTTAP